uniref:Peptidase S1 domain-containing protein n=1 Tax=Sphenodon punctatus TaxID=8508 RepID=A0A8D0HG24_SPHPU
MGTGTGNGTYTCLADGSWKDQYGLEDIPVCWPVCGKPDKPITSIQQTVGGSEAPQGSFPWQAMTAIHGRGGGALLGNLWILTAAHTIYPKWRPDSGERESLIQIAERTEVFLGHTTVDKLHRLGSHPIRRVFVHPGYRPNENHDFDGDIALIELQDPVTLGPNLLPICLPDAGNSNFYTRGRMGYASGFGVEEYFLPEQLKYTALPVTGRASCQEWLRGKKVDGKDPVFSENMFCAGSPHRKDTCQGDSGGAFSMLDQESGRWVATGIVSWGIGCDKGYGFYTKILHYLDWIKGITGENWL